jgi:hypothetical protein
MSASAPRHGVGWIGWERKWARSTARIGKRLLEKKRAHDREFRNEPRARLVFRGGEWIEAAHPLPIVDEGGPASVASHHGLTVSS